MVREQLAGGLKLAQSWDASATRGASTMNFDVPNLDGVWEDDLLAYEAVFELLRDYAGLKREAMALRVRGLVNLAIVKERQCEHVYKQLPEWARW